MLYALQEEILNICKQLEQLKEKNARLGSKKFATKLNAMHECTLRTLDELSIDEDFSSAPSQERSTDDSKATSDVNRSSTTRKVSNASYVNTKRETACSTNSEDNRLKYAKKNSGPSRLRKYIFRNTNFFSNSDKNAAQQSSNENVQTEPIQAHAIIFTVEEKSKYSQVSL